MRRGAKEVHCVYPCSGCSARVQGTTNPAPPQGAECSGARGGGGGGRGWLRSLRTAGRAAATTAADALLVRCLVSWALQTLHHRSKQASCGQGAFRGSHIGCGYATHCRFNPYPLPYPGPHPLAHPYP